MSDNSSISSLSSDSTIQSLDVFAVSELLFLITEEINQHSTTWEKVQEIIKKFEKRYNVKFHKF